MSDKPDLVIRGGQLVDGSGQPAVQADVAISGGQISAVGQINESGIDEIDARDRLVMPGFVDVQTHYDAQVTWANQITPSSCKGVTTVCDGQWRGRVRACSARRARHANFCDGGC